VQYWCCQGLGSCFSGAEPGSAGCWKDENLCGVGMQSCTPDLEDVVQPLASEPYSAEDPEGSCVEPGCKVRET